MDTLVAIIAARDALFLDFVEQIAGAEAKAGYEKALKSMDMQIELFGGPA